MLSHIFVQGAIWIVQGDDVGNKHADMNLRTFRTFILQDPRQRVNNIAGLASGSSIFQEGSCVGWSMNVGQAMAKND